MASKQPWSSTPTWFQASGPSSSSKDPLFANVHLVQCEVSTKLDWHEVLKHSMMKLWWQMMTQARKTTTGQKTMMRPQNTDSPVMTEDDDSDAAEHEASEESTPLQKKRKLDRSKRYFGKDGLSTLTADPFLAWLHILGVFCQALFIAHGFESSSPSIHASASAPRVCNSCAPVLEMYAITFKVRQGSELQQRKSVNPYPWKPDFQHYRALVRQNKWLHNNIFDVLGYYLFCNQCVHFALSVSLKCLAHLQNVKKAQFQNPVKVMTEHKVEDVKLGKFVIMPNKCELWFVLWCGNNSSLICSMILQLLTLIVNPMGYIMTLPALFIIFY